MEAGLVAAVGFFDGEAAVVRAAVVPRKADGGGADADGGAGCVAAAVAEAAVSQLLEEAEAEGTSSPGAQEASKGKSPASIQAHPVFQSL